MTRYNQKSIAHPDNFRLPEYAPNTTLRRDALLLSTALLALMPVSAQAADNWTGTTSNAWATTTNWDSGTPTSTSAVNIGVNTHNPVQITTGVSLNGVGGSLLVGSGESLNLGSSTPTGSLTMGSNSITLNGIMTLYSATRGVINLAGGSITGTGSITSTVGAINGYGTVSVPVAGATWNANTSGQALTLTGGSAGRTYGGAFTSTSSTGFFNWNGITLNGITTSGAGGAYNLNGATINAATLNNSGGGQLNVIGDSTLQGAINWYQYDTFNLGGANGAHTLNLSAATLSTVTGGAAPFIIGAGGVLNNASGASSMGGGGTVTMTGGSITTSTGAGLFKIGDPISGYGTISGNVDIAGSVTAAGSGHTMTLNGGTGAGMQLGNSSGSGATFGTSGGATVDMQGKFNLIEPANMNPGTGVVQLDGATFSNGFSSSPVSINNSGLSTAGLFKVTNASTFDNVAFSTGNGANLEVDALLTATNKASLNATNVTVSASGGLNLSANAGSTELTTKNLTMAKGSTLNVGGSNDGISLSGNFSFQQTDKVNAWTYGGKQGLGPDLIMTGGSMATPLTLEVGGVNEGNVAAGYVDNFALDKLSLGSGAHVDLVDQNANATPLAQWVSGDEALYLDGLFGVTAGGADVIPTLDLEGLHAYLEGSPGYLKDGLYVDSLGGEINITGAPTPEAATITMILLGFAGLSLGAARRRKNRLDATFA